MKHNHIIQKIKELYHEAMFLQNPTFPEFTFIPDLAIKKEDKLIIVEIVELKLHENVDWRTLRLLEFLFEVKLTLGNNTIFNLIINNKALLQPYCIELLENLFDKVYYFEEFDELNVFNLLVKTQHNELWDLERQYVRTQYHNISDIDLKKYVLDENNNFEIEDKIQTILRQANLEVKRNVPMRNLKNDFITGEKNLRFVFDFRAHNKLIEYKSFKRISNTDIQNLLIQARLVRYTKEGGFLHLVNTTKKLVLLINGKIDGPSYDPNRFIKMLIGAGWQIYPISILEHHQEFIDLIKND
jgi:hypothetical protein